MKNYFASFEHADITLREVQKYSPQDVCSAVSCYSHSCELNLDIQKLILFRMCIF